MKTELSEYYGNGNGRTAKVLIETMGTEKRFYVYCYTKDMWNGTVEKSTICINSIVVSDNSGNAIYTQAGECWIP